MALIPPADDRFDVLFASHDIAVHETIAWLNKNAAFARNGPASLDCKGLQSVVVRHFSTPTMQPHIHSHVLVKPTVVGLDERTYPLHWAILQESIVAAVPMFMMTLRHQLTQALGVSWTSDYHESKWELAEIPYDALTMWPDRMCTFPGVPLLQRSMS